MDNVEYWRRRYWEKSVEYWNVCRESESKTWWMMAEAFVICICLATIMYLIQ